MGYCDAESHDHPLIEQLESLLLEKRRLEESNRRLLNDLNTIAIQVGVKYPPTCVDVLARIKALKKDEGDADKLLATSKQLEEQKLLVKNTVDALLAERTAHEQTKLKLQSGIFMEFTEDDLKTLRFIRAAVEDDRAAVESRRTGEWWVTRYDEAVTLLDRLLGNSAT